VYLLVWYLVIGNTECGWVGPGWQKTAYDGGAIQRYLGVGTKVLEELKKV